MGRGIFNNKMRNLGRNARLPYKPAKRKEQLGLLANPRSVRPADGPQGPQVRKEAQNDEICKI